VARSSKTLVSRLAALGVATGPFAALRLTAEQSASVAALPDDLSVSQTIKPLELADRQDAIEEWLEDHDAGAVEAEPLARSGVTVDDLDALARAVGTDKAGAVLAHESAQRAVRQLAAEIDTAATRIHTLVAAVKGFTYLNQQGTLMPIAIGQGLSDTVTVLRSKARRQSVEIEMNVAGSLPAVEGYGGELNQVWANLLDNAIDATPSGRVRIEADSAGGKVVVRVIDNGPGIPADIVGRIFDPFFTTKDVGEGTGLGLDIARRIVQRHHGVIDVSTNERGTEFRVILPAIDASPSGI
jgi:signal transduction histidine kinase